MAGDRVLQDPLLDGGHHIGAFSLKMDEGVSVATFLQKVVSKFNLVCKVLYYIKVE